MWSVAKCFVQSRVADSEFIIPGSIDIILGADVYGQIIEDGIIKGETNSPIAQLTKFGWVISGPSSYAASSTSKQSYHVSMDRSLHDLLHRFWELEEIPSRGNFLMSTEEQECERHFQKTHSRDEQGRYVVRLPFKDNTAKLGDSRRKAVRMIKSLSRKFASDPSYAQSYSEFINEYEKLQHLKLVQESSINSESHHHYYLPHHGVIREHSLTTKLRVVFNGSSRTTTGVSLNDLLHTGAKLQVDLFDVLIWFRQFCYVFFSDIEKMYRQIKVNSEDWNFQRILWINQSNDIITYQLKTVTYGLACAPFLALRTLKQLVDDEGDKFPLAIQVLTKGRYVDDLFGGSDTIQQTQKIIKDVNQLCMAGGFPLQKWISNHPSILQSIPTDKQITTSTLPIEENMIVHALGLNWKPTTDTFHFTLQLPPIKKITKRSILSTIAKLFDPLGLLSPVIIKAKIIIQELWSVKLDWDDPLPSLISNRWTAFVEQLQEMPNLSFPRWLGYKSDHHIELHGFCDASQQAMSAVIYLRSTSSEGEIQTSIICSKTKVAPLKRLTIPRLELSGAVLLTKLTSHIIRILELDKVSVYLWTDSSITYHWINNHPSRWKDFVHNRVCYIQETVPQAIWHFVPGHENPADLATRGLTPNQLSEMSIWWNGPQWILQQSSMWPKEPKAIPSKYNLEERQVQISTIATNYAVAPWNLLNRYSDLTRLLRITAICRRTIQRFRRTNNSSLTLPITPQELEDAKLYWVKVVQQYRFQQEIKIISKGQPLSKSNSLLKLTPFMDTEGLLRVGGRLQSSHLPTSAKHPLILPKESTLTQLIIADAHLRTMHGGTQLTLSFIRNNYWITGGRAPVRSHILKCVRCARYRQKRAQQIMGQLPVEKLTPSRPFLNSGVDYAGPLMIKTWKGKNAKTYKAYLALFVCHATSAIHLELVTDYSTDAFIAAYKRFTARRGICATLMSDCGTNLRGADFELTNLFSTASKELGNLATILAKDGTQWKFNPPSAPHFGGKWEAGVKSVKYHLKRIIGDALLTYEEMTTLITQIEAVLNSRPLSPLSDDPEDLNALTPGHFLIGNAPAIIPEPSLKTIKSSRLSRWQLLRQMLDNFWVRWSTECLQRYLAVYKWNKSVPSLKEGSLVLVIDERYPPSKWPLGRVIQTHPGKDGHTRVVTVRTQISSFKRPIVKLCPLPISVDTL